MMPFSDVPPLLWDDLPPGYRPWVTGPRGFEMVARVFPDGSPIPHSHRPVWQHEMSKAEAQRVMIDEWLPTMDERLAWVSKESDLVLDSSVESLGVLTVWARANMERRYARDAYPDGQEPDCPFFELMDLSEWPSWIGSSSEWYKWTLRSLLIWDALALYFVRVCTTANPALSLKVFRPRESYHSNWNKAALTGPKTQYEPPLPVELAERVCLMLPDDPEALSYFMMDWARHTIAWDFAELDADEAWNIGFADRGVA